MLKPETGEMHLLEAKEHDLLQLCSGFRSIAELSTLLVAKGHRVAPLAVEAMIRSLEAEGLVEPEGESPGPRTRVDIEAAFREWHKDPETLPPDHGDEIWNKGQSKVPALPERESPSGSKFDEGFLALMDRVAEEIETNLVSANEPGGKLRTKLRKHRGASPATHAKAPERNRNRTSKGAGDSKDALRQSSSAVLEFGSLLSSMDDPSQAETQLASAVPMDPSVTILQGAELYDSDTATVIRDSELEEGAPEPLRKR